jgi:DNA segregation ATPase FtsK/SpoIIIE, S-DNA-T family
MQNAFLDRQQKALAELAELVARRAAGERDIDRRHAARAQEIVDQHKALREQLTGEFEKDIIALRGEYRQLREEAIYQYESSSYNVVQQAEKFDKDAAEELERGQERAKRQFQITQRTAIDEFDQNKDRPGQDCDRIRRRCLGRLEEIEEVGRQAQKVLRRRKCAVPEDAIATAELAADADPHDHFTTALAAAKARLQHMIRQPAARFLEDGWPFLIFLFASAALAWPAVHWLGWGWGVGACLASGAIIGLGVRQLVRPVARRQTLADLPGMLQALAEGRAAMQVAIRRAELEAQRKLEELVEKRERAVSEAHARWGRTRVELVEQHQVKVKQATEQFRARRKELQEVYHRTLKSLDEKYPPLIDQRETRFAAEAQTLVDQRRQQLEANQADLEQAWQSLVRQWADGLGGFRAAIEDMNRVCDAWTPAWDQVDWNAWKPESGDLPALRFGHLQFQLNSLPEGVSRHAHLQVPQTEFTLPAALSYPECPSLLYFAEAEGRDVAIRSLQDVMLRLLTSLPAGKVRFTIVDPTGLGQNFSAFMHLADFDERLVSSRIWTETAHINKRLNDLTEHMENVIQKYLRNEFDSIQQYNQHAGEVAEPFQILVVANFPANFSEEAARRLVSIAVSGARCGVYTLISVDQKMKLPRNFELADLQVNALSLEWDGQRFVLPYPRLRELPLTLEQPPGDDRVTSIVRCVGERAKDASRVEVPFGSVTPPESDWWTLDSRSEIEVPLGRAGATNLQYLRLGKGTSQHVLISGKTGSGKSTLLHAMITNLALYYSPDEVHFYLVDFKKGVEFKPYASLNLPHARVIAIESEREFGMSVLQRLDVELKRRGDLFRNQGVQDLKGYRDANPEVKLPRVLLIIDEFQEFFVQDDKISQDASLLLDRLVRQGRAFGIHVLLGSQTLAGAYTLARSTLGQMAVRIALQCSESDAHLILSDDNTAARLLSRPGEAIYNDANGLFEGNHPFQVVWLPDHEREDYLQRVSSLATARHLQPPPAIVFEGNTAADPAKNELLRDCLQQPRPTGMTAPRAWLGAAVAIKDPACAVFRRQGGANLLVVGQQEQMALGMLATSIVSLAAELCGPQASFDRDATGSAPLDALAESTPSAPSTPAAPQFIVLDGQRPDSPSIGFWNRLAKQLPLEMRVAATNGCADVIRHLADEVERRLQQGDSSGPPIFLIVYNLARFRELRKSEEYSFSLDDSAPSVALDKQFSTLLREGPNFGIHTLIWCDNFTNLNRWLDRQVLHDLAMRVLFQMSAGDSANLMDTPEASRLGIHRAILYNEEQGEFEKFRPYGLPDDAWLRWVRDQLLSRTSAPA